MTDSESYLSLSGGIPSAPPAPLSDCATPYCQGLVAYFDAMNVRMQVETVCKQSQVEQDTTVIYPAIAAATIMFVMVGGEVVTRRGKGHLARSVHALCKTGLEYPTAVVSFLLIITFVTIHIENQINLPRNVPPNAIKTMIAAGLTVSLATVLSKVLPEEKGTSWLSKMSKLSRVATGHLVGLLVIAISTTVTSQLVADKVATVWLAKQCVPKTQRIP